ncbi:hypothetical protein [Acinetobacter sp. 'aerobic (ED)']|uniref:hypothetical protein n=1 Tax=Acinetobacter sp. 'aerobic (ED)' TaxID=174230 RepID=UPI00192AB308|nr:hypothetical protein [Acinetobacter sp. 'aerobic (ED)']
MNKLKLVFLITCLSYVSSLYADNIDNQYVKEYEDLQLKLKSQSNHEIMKEIGMIYDLNRNASSFQTNLKLHPYITEIRNRGKNGDIEAKFISNSLWNRNICEGMMEQKMYSVGDTCSSVINNLKEIANNKKDRRYTAQSMESLGDIYNKGVVASKSDLLAAEWYYKAAVEYNNLGKRDESIRTLEQALNILPSYKPALIFRKSIFGY